MSWMSNGEETHWQEEICPFRSCFVVVLSFGHLSVHDRQQRHAGELGPPRACVFQSKTRVAKSVHCPLHTSSCEKTDKINVGTSDHFDQACSRDHMRYEVQTLWKESHPLINRFIYIKIFKHGILIETFQLHKITK